MQSLALVETTKTNRKINQTNTKKQNTIIYYLNTQAHKRNMQITKDAQTQNLTIQIQN